MSAFGVVMVGFGVLLIWSGYKRHKINQVLGDFLQSPGVPVSASTPPAKTSAATTTTPGTPTGVITV